jgi:CspA family cold shock protein
MLRGTVKWFHDLKGYGFISSEDLPEVVYVRFSDICTPGYRTLKKGDKVTFDLEESANGARATNVTKI